MAVDFSAIWTHMSLSYAQPEIGISTEVAQVEAIYTDNRYVPIVVVLGAGPTPLRALPGRETSAL